MPTDVAEPAQAQALARTAAERFGGVDVWVNMAGVAALGPFERIPIEAQRRLVEVNLIGTMNGAWAALPPMLRRNRGVVINVASLAGRVPQPFAAAYSASKFGVAGFTEALRHELLARSAVQVCGVYPAFVDTPIPLHAANHSGRAVRPVPPVLDPGHVAERIVGLALRPRRALRIGAPHALAPFHALAPEAAGRLVGRLAERFVLRSGPEAVNSSTTFSILDLRPSRARSSTKSQAHTWFARSGRRRTQEPSFSHSRPRLGCRRGTFSPSRRQMRSTRLWLRRQPSARSSAVTRRWP